MSHFRKFVSSSYFKGAVGAAGFVFLFLTLNFTRHMYLQHRNMFRWANEVEVERVYMQKQGKWPQVDALNAASKKSPVKVVNRDKKDGPDEKKPEAKKPEAKPEKKK